MRKLFALTTLPVMLSTTLLHATATHSNEPNVEGTQPPVTQTQKTEPQQQSYTEKEDYLLFADIELGAAFIKNTFDGTVTLNQTPNTTGTALSAGVGINWNAYMFSTLNYQAGFMEMFDLNNVYATFNGKLPFKNITPYGGILMGYSNLHWNKNPIDYTSKTEDSNSFLIGFQAGVEIALLERLSFLLNYKYEAVFHKTNLQKQGNAGSIKSNGFQSFNAGLRIYLF